MTEADVFAVISKSQEFDQIKVSNLKSNLIMARPTCIFDISIYQNKKNLKQNVSD